MLKMPRPLNWRRIAASPTRFLKPLCLGLALCGGAISQAGAVGLDKQAVTRVILEFEGRQVADFKTFAVEAAALEGQAGLAAAAARLAAGEALSAQESQSLYRLLGVYVHLKYRDQMVATLGQLVSVSTYKRDGRPQWQNPGIRSLGSTLGRLATEFGLDFRNIDNRIFEVSLPGSGDQVIGLHAHGDTVPADPAKWGLDDGTPLNPFSLTIIGDRMYGRGAEDDKNGIVVAIFAMKAIRDAGFAMKRTIRLLIDTTEETDGAAIEYYRARHGIPPYNIALDGSYPVAVAEKGYGTVKTFFARRLASGRGAEIVAMAGGLATNQIPKSAPAEILAADPAALADRLNTLGAAYVTAHGGNFRIEATPGKGKVDLVVHGTSAHSSAPQTGVNPVSRLFDFIHTVRDEVPFKLNHMTDAARYVSENWGLDYLGVKFGIAYSDDFMGPLTAALTLVETRKNGLFVVVNTRMPRGKTPQALKTEIESKIIAWRQLSGISMALEVEQGGFMYRDPRGPWITTLLDIFAGHTGLKSVPVSSAGGTTAKTLPNGIQFGLSLPGARYSGHNANEFKSLENFLLDARIVTEMMLRLGNLEKME